MLGIDAVGLDAGKGKPGDCREGQLTSMPMLFGKNRQ